LARGVKLEKILKDSDVEYQILHTEYAGQAEELAAASSSDSENKTAVIAVGGDGTLNEVASGLLSIDKSKRPLFGIIPSGTGNDYQKMFDIGKNVKEQLATCISGSTVRADTASISWEDDRGSGNTFYINLAGFGFDAMAASKQQRQKKIKGSIGYLFAVISTLVDKKSFPVEIEILRDGEWASVFKDDLLLANIGMGKSSGGIFKINPFAIIDDGAFEYCCVADLSIPRILNLIPKVIRGKHWESRFVTKGRAQELRIYAPEGLPMQTDGELLSLSAKKIKIKILPRSLNIIART